MQKIIYPGTFDPITNGHIDIIDRANRLFEHVIVGIAKNSQKGPVLTLAKRLALVKTVLQKYPNVEVLVIDGLLIEFAKKIGVNIILRGLRAVSDFEYEFQLAGMNRHLNNTIETIFLTPADKYAYISSSLVREIAELGGDISEFVPKEVVEELKK